MGDSGVPGFFVFFAVLVVALGIGSTIWRVSAARRIARSNGLDPDDATAVALLDKEGLAATYLGTHIGRGQPAPPKSTEERLAELERLRAAGTITEAEYAATKQRILDAL